MLGSWKKFLSDEDAPTAIEYAIMVAGIAVVIIAVVFILGGRVRDLGQHGRRNPPAAGR
jgi:Flp pilus assembly pilin Flp